MLYHIIYDKLDGQILHVHSVFDGEMGAFVELGRDEILAELRDYIPEEKDVEVLLIPVTDRAERTGLHGMRVNPADMKLEPIDSKHEE